MKCLCGCGKETKIATRNRPNRCGGMVRGQPMKYVKNHALTVTWRSKGIPLNYEITDTGYVTPCWLWKGNTSKGGYATYGRRRVHRVFMESAGISIPDGKEPDHLCRVKHCVRPDHCEAVTHTENVRRGPHTILTADDVLKIRQRLAAGESQTSIAKDFGCCQVNISRIKTGKSWSDVY